MTNWNYKHFKSSSEPAILLAISNIYLDNGHYIFCTYLFACIFHNCVFMLLKYVKYCHLVWNWKICQYFLQYFCNKKCNTNIFPTVRLEFVLPTVGTDFHESMANSVHVILDLHRLFWVQPMYFSILSYALWNTLFSFSS